MNTTSSERQTEFERLVSDALQDKDLVEALRTFEMGEEAYIRAITSSTVIKIFSGDTSNPEGNIDANLDTD